MNQNILISIVVPIYNVEKYLNQAIDSILAQTHKNLEVILINDGSKDNCGQICDEYAAKDNRIKVVHKENGGLGAAYNTGIEMATGDYIAFVEPDDYIDARELFIDIKSDKDFKWTYTKYYKEIILAINSNNYKKTLKFDSNLLYRNVSYTNIFQRLFSVKNFRINTQKYKVTTILGIKIKNKLHKFNKEKK